jgi:hypothetical protein
MSSDLTATAMITGRNQVLREFGKEQAKRRTRVRGFSLFDGMILVAATAVGLSVVRSGSDPIMGRKVLIHPELLFQIAAPFVAAWTVAVFAAGLIGRRRSVRRLARSPGWAACAAAFLILLWIGLFHLSIFWPPREGESAVWFRVWHRTMSADPLAMIYSWSLLIGPAVTGTWLVLALGGRRSCDRGWLNSAGRFLGLCWVVFWVSSSWQDSRDFREGLKRVAGREEARAAGLTRSDPEPIVSATFRIRSR